MKWGTELWNRPSTGTQVEQEGVIALGGQAAKLRAYHPSALVYWLSSIWPQWSAVVRPSGDGLIMPSGQVAEVLPLLSVLHDMGVPTIYILDSEPNHPDNPSRTRMMDDYISRLRQLVALIRRASPYTPLCAPPMAVYNNDIVWYRVLEPVFAELQIEYRACQSYWQDDNYNSYDWGRRIEQYAQICPNNKWIVAEVGDSTGGKSAHKKVDAYIDVLNYLQDRGDVHLAFLFLAAGGTHDWGTFFIPADQLGRIKLTQYQVGEGFQKAVNVKPWKESEVWHFPGSPHETSMAVGDNGYATWRRKTNTTVMVTDEGEIWSDLGGGPLVRVHPKA